MSFFYNIFYLSLGLNIKDINRPNSKDAVIPADADVKPPIRTPKKPSLSTDLRTPSANVWPNPNSGTLAPAPANYSCNYIWY